MPRYQGKVVVYVEVGVDDLTHNTRILRGAEFGLEEMGLKVISQWRFRPGTKDAKSVNVVATIEVNWRLI